jgi:xylan 1,4-beta-xylosidase
MASNGFTLPVFNVFRMMALMSGDRIDAQSTGDAGLEEIIRAGVRGAPDVAALASVDSPRHRLTALVWHYHDDDLPGAPAVVSLDFSGLPADANQVTVSRYLVDADHSNAYTMWQSLGSPAVLSRGQYQQIETASKLAKLGGEPTSTAVSDGRTELKITLPRQAVTLVVLAW